MRQHAQHADALFPYCPICIAFSGKQTAGSHHDATPFRTGTITDHIPGNYTRELGRSVAQTDRSVVVVAVVIIITINIIVKATLIVMLLGGYQRQLDGYLAVSVHVIVPIGRRGCHN